MVGQGTRESLIFEELFLRLNMRDLKVDTLSPEIARLRAELVALDDDELRSAWEPLHNPFRESDRSVH